MRLPNRAGRAGLPALVRSTSPARSAAVAGLIAPAAMLAGTQASAFAQEVPAARDEPVADAVAAIDSVLRERVEDGFAGVIMLRAADGTLLDEAYGLADREAGRPMTTSTGFDIGSLVKPITAVTVLRLEELGLLSTEDPISRWFPEAPPAKAGITVWQLLTHTSGLPDIFGDDYDVVTRDWVLERALSADLLGPPGEEERYSNAGYSLLAMIIEEVTGQPYEAAVREHALLPAGTPGIGYRLAGWTRDRLAVGYRGAERWGTPLDHPWAADGPGWNLRGNGGMLATAEEMSRWYEALFDGRILGTRALDKYYGFDAGESASAGGRALAHAGGNGIFNTLQVSWIDHDVHMTLFTSVSRPRNAETVWQDIREHVMAIARARAAQAESP